MGDGEIPTWLKGLPLAPEYRPTETEFADPIAYISRIEKEASTFGICKVVPPLPKPSKKYVLSNLNKSLSKCPELGSDAADCSPSQVGLGDKGNGNEARAVFTTRHQELGHGMKRLRGPVPIQKQVWQSGEVYTLDQFESKSRVFARSHLGGMKDVSPLVIESLFWKAATEKPIYIEYANDVPGSGFGEPEDPFLYFRRRKRRRRFDQKHQESINHEKHKAGPTMGDGSINNAPLPSSSNLSSEDGLGLLRQKILNLGCSDREGTAGWKISNSPWNLQVIARSRGSLTRFMPDDIPGVTSPMVYIGMLFSWFAWHVEDHELHSLNFLHMGAPKTWYAIPGDYAFTLEEVIRVQGYGGHLDRLGALTLLGEKTSLLSPEAVIASGIPCCRLVQNPGEFVVTFPRAYHVGFSHGFNCGEAANFATPQWLKVAKEAAVRRAAMNFLPMLSHQQLLYMLTMSFVSRVPRALLPGVRSSRLRDRKKEEREILVKKAFIDDVVNENYLLSVLLGKESTSRAVLWDPESLPSPSNSSLSVGPAVSVEANGLLVCERNKEDGSCKGNAFDDASANVAETSSGNARSANLQKPDIHNNKVDGTSSYMEAVDYLYEDDDDLPCGMHVDSGTLACVACGVLGFPFMSIVQPSDRASKEFFPEELRSVNPPTLSCIGNMLKDSDSDATKATGVEFEAQGRPHDNQTGKSSAKCMGHIPVPEVPNDGRNSTSLNNGILESSSNTVCSSSEVIAIEEQKEVDALHQPIGASSVEHGTAKPIGTGEPDTPNTIHPSNGLSESRGSMPMERVKEDLKSTNILDAEPCKGTKGLSDANAEESGEKVNRQWNTSNIFLRPRIFCLEHALEIEELLQSKGGANVLIICHSDYPKIKGEAMSIAEEIGSNFKFKDFPLESASQSDLNLINISIDDEHEECREDWTSKLGLNLRHCVMIRKQCQSKQEQPALALGGLFSDHVPASGISTLKWHCRKSRTHHKASGLSLSKSHDDVQMKKDDLIGRNSDTDVVTEDQVNEHSRNPYSEVGAFARACRSRGRGRPRKHHLPNPKEMTANSTETTTSIERGPDNNNNRSCFGEGSSVHEKAGNVTVELAVSPTIADPTPETSETQEGIWNTQENNIALEGCDSAMSVDMPTSDEISGSWKEIQAPGRTNTGGEVCESAMLVGPPTVALGVVGSSEVLHEEIPTIEETSMVSHICDSAISACLPPAIDIATVSSKTEQEVPATVENTTVSEDSNYVDLGKQPIETSETFKEIRSTEGTGLAGGVYDSAKLQSQPSISVSILDCSQMQLGEIGTIEETDMTVDPATMAVPPAIPILTIENSKKNPASERTTTVGEPYNSAKTADQPTAAISMANHSEIDNGNEVFDSVKLVGLPTIAFLSAKSSEMQQETLTTTAEITTVGDAGDSAKSAGPSSVSLAAAGNSEIQKGNQPADEMNHAGAFHSSRDGMERTKSNPIIVYSRAVRKQNKRKREEEEKTDLPDSHSTDFIRSPCEGLRPRTRRNPDRGTDISCRTPEGKVAKKVVNRTGDKKSYPCDLDGCRMSFATKAELLLHKRNRCTHEGCRKRFSSHKYAMHHERVHSEERPLKCPWKGCGMSFKWAWARTEHVRVHTGERPYQCKVAGCGLTFRFVSDFSRHRRKTGHSVN
ncbi:lysine-specific demethylase ELF6 isoform X2 [Magnolia sinica]|uniref:lysine-specific demethylase ELF6 isoform X2 n=1 Tax=Magnolia sinica TaxID=86752 RepID=UPI002658B51E|nr:lysine-specific demethylase ELF6 isoform X2 [Magnolia sinica]